MTTLQIIHRHLLQSSYDKQIKNEIENVAAFVFSMLLPFLSLFLFYMRIETDGCVICSDVIGYWLGFLELLMVPFRAILGDCK